MGFTHVRARDLCTHAGTHAHDFPERSDSFFTDGRRETDQQTCTGETGKKSANTHPRTHVYILIRVTCHNQTITHTYTNTYTLKNTHTENK